MLFPQLFSVKAMLCTVQGIYSCAKGSTDWSEREMENYGAAVAAVCSSVCLCSVISAGPVRGHNCVLKQKPVPFYLSIHCWQWEPDRTPGFLLLTSLLSSLPNWADRADTGTCSFPCPGLHRKNMVDVPGTRELQGGHSKSHQHVKPKFNVVHNLPSSLTAGWMKEMLKISAWCQLLSRPPSLACCGLWSIAPLMPQPWPLKHRACCQ